MSVNAAESEPSSCKQKRKHQSPREKAFRISRHGASPIRLLVFLVDVEDGALFVEGYVEGFRLLD
jgi:hypothetical protein